ncbi:MAG: hypothetical protein FJ150_08570 [Euryarchaeota archaeon]|nr:hypothetical protein [Euryarchaeota archaeon]
MRIWWRITKALLFRKIEIISMNKNSKFLFIVHYDTLIKREAFDEINKTLELQGCVLYTRNMDGIKIYEFKEK